MALRRRATRLLDHVPIVAGWVAVAAAVLPVRDGMGFAMSAAIVGPPLVGIWAILAMRHHIGRLCEVHLRESLKLTLLPADVFLRSQLRDRVKLLLSPLWKVYPVLLALGAARILFSVSSLQYGPNLGFIFFFVPLLAGEAASAGGVAVIAICRMLRSHCRSGNRTGSGIGVAAAYSIFLLLAPIGFWFFAGLMYGLLNEFGLFLIPVAALALGGWLCSRARAEIDRAVAAYYEIEAAPPRRIG